MTSEKINCTFCKIISKNDPKTLILFENEKIVIFNDIKPASDFHFLAVPKEHIDNAKSLTIDHRYLVEEMKVELENLLQSKNVNLDQVLLGFHWPPFNSIHHLHMHAIAPVSNMGFIGRCIFKPNNLWFRTVEYVLARLQVSSSSL